MSDQGLRAVSDQGNSEKGTRFAELAVELLGARFAGDFLKEIWASASPDQRQAFADAILARVAQEQIVGEVPTIVRQTVTQIVNAEVQRRIEADRPRINAVLTTAVEQAITGAVDSVVGWTRRAVAEKHIEAIKAQLHAALYKMGGTQ
ncbi:MAG: hypothetical protein Q8S13_01040 [Dehalococcoidia bacterium]|nr:hypothetical protein [Dehalococcoidia bacterium]